MNNKSMADSGAGATGGPAGRDLSRHSGEEAEGDLIERRVKVVGALDRLLGLNDHCIKGKLSAHDGHRRVAAEPWPRTL